MAAVEPSGSPGVGSVVRGRGRGRGFLSYNSLQPAVLLEQTLAPAKPESHQFDDAAAASVAIAAAAAAAASVSTPDGGLFGVADSASTPSDCLFSAASVQVSAPLKAPSPLPLSPMQSAPLPTQSADVLVQPVSELASTVDAIIQEAATNKSSGTDLAARLEGDLSTYAEGAALALHSAVLADRRYAREAALCCHRLALAEKGGSAFRSFLLRALQSDFKNRANIFEKSESDFLSCVTLLCNVFAVMRDRGGTPYIVLSTPVVEYLSMMLQDFSLTDSASESLADNLHTVGALLQNKAAEKEQALIESVRQKILDEKTDNVTRCRLLKVLEVSLREWKPLEEKVETFYDMNLNNLKRDSSN